MMRNLFLPGLAATAAALCVGTAYADAGGPVTPRYCQSAIIASIVPAAPKEGRDWSVEAWAQRVKTDMDGVLYSLLLAAPFEELVHDPCATWYAARLASTMGEVELAGVLTRELGSGGQANPPEQRLIDQIADVDVDVDPSARLTIDGLPLFRGCDANGPFAFPWSQTRHGIPPGNSAASGHTEHQACWHTQGTTLRVRLYLRRSTHVAQLTRGDTPLATVTLVATDPDKLSSRLELVSPAPAPGVHTVEVRTVSVVSAPSPWPFVAMGAFSLALGTGAGAVWAEANVHERIVDYRKIEPTPSDLTRAAAAIHAAQTERTVLESVAIGSAAVGALGLGLWVWAPTHAAEDKVAPKVGFGLSARDGFFATAYGAL
jgi:hypothetical protein